MTRSQPQKDSGVADSPTGPSSTPADLPVAGTASTRRPGSTATRGALLLAAAAALTAFWLVSQDSASRVEAAQAAPDDSATQGAVGSPRAHFVAGRFDEARDAYRALWQAGGEGAAAAQRDLAFLEAVTWGKFDASLETLRALHDRDHDYGSIAHMARLLAVRGERETALSTALQAIQLRAQPLEMTELLECVLAGMPASPSVDAACRRLLELDPWSTVARSALLRSAVLRDDFAGARACWRNVHFVDLLADELYDPRAAEIETLFEPAATDATTRWQLGCALATRGRLAEAAHCLRDTVDEASSNWRVRAERFAAFAKELEGALQAAFRAGFADGRWQQTIRTALPALCTTLGATTTAELYLTLRDDYRLYLALLSGDPLHLNSEATEIVHVDEQRGPAALQVERVRRVVTGAPSFRMAWALSPLTLGAGSKDVVRWDWPDTVVLHATYSIAQAAEAYAVSTGVRTDPSADLPPMIDPAAQPRQVASAFMVGNQGNHCFERMRATVTKELSKQDELEPDGSQAWRDAFVGALTRADLQAAALHEMRHIADLRLRTLERSERELRAFLTELEFAPAAARYLRLGIVATGGAPAASGDPYEAANLDLLAGFIRTLANDAEFAPQVDRTRNLQAQLHLLEPDEIAEVARRITASRATAPK